MSKITDGKGSGRAAEVNIHNRLETDATSHSAQSRASIQDEQSYQISTTHTITNSDVPMLYLQNDSSTHHLVITYIRVMSIGAAASNVGAYFTILLGDSYTSGGTALTAINVNENSGNIADSTAYDGTNSLTVSGGSEIDRNWTANTMQSYDKEGSVVLGKNDSITINHLGSTVAGTAYARISYYFIEKT
jgi:hypothetical protein